MPSYAFSLRASTRKGGYPGRLYLRVVYGADSRSVTTEYRVFPEEWDAVRRWLKLPYGRGERGRQLAEIENSMMCDLRRMEVVLNKLKKEGAYTIDDVMSRFRVVMQGNTLAAYTEKLAKEMEQGGYIRTAKAYRTAATRLIEFSGDKNLSYERITPALLGDFQAELKAGGRTMNTISCYMRTLRAIYNKAINEGRIARRSDNLFGNVYTGVSTTRKRALTHDELAMLVAFDPTEEAPSRSKRQDLPEHLQPGLAMFLFCYHARGMCFIDMAYLKKTDYSLQASQDRTADRASGVAGNASHHRLVLHANSRKPLPLPCYYRPGRGHQSSIRERSATTESTVEENRRTLRYCEEILDPLCPPLVGNGGQECGTSFGSHQRGIGTHQPTDNRDIYGLAGAFCPQSRE